MPRQANRTDLGRGRGRIDPLSKPAKVRALTCAGKLEGALQNKRNE